MLDILLEYGVNHIDVAARYGDAELRIGPWMARHRQDFFLATKTGKRLYQDARDEIHRSLERLRVDAVDLIQLHALFHPDDWDLAMGPGGALEAAIEAREQGLVRFIGVTGHGWTIAAMHKRSLERFDFDSVLLPYNYVMHQNERYREDFDAVVRLCQERQVAVQTIKAIARGPWATTEKARNTWYQPLEEQADIDRAVHWVIGRPGIFLNTAGDIHLLPKILEAASRYDTRPDDDAMTAMLEKQSVTTLFGLGPAGIRCAQQGDVHGQTKVLMTGAAGYIASQLLPTFRERYDVVLVDVTQKNRQGEEVKDIVVLDLIDPDRSKYTRYFEGVDAVVHLGYKRRSGPNPLEHFFDEKQNVEMAYNVFRTAYDAGVKRVIMASSNHAADWYEHALIHQRAMEVLEPYTLPLSDNFYGWAKATYEHMGFLFACGGMDFRDVSGREQHTGGNLGTARKLGVVMVRIGAPRELDITLYKGDPMTYKRDLGAYISPRDLTQLFRKAIDTLHIENEHGIPWQVVYGISNNTRAFWSLANARKVLGYEPEDDSEVKFAKDIQGFLIGDGATGGPGRVGR